MLSGKKPTSTAKLADFGLAQALETSGNGVSSTAGTFGYQAPEIMQGKNYGTEADIWQLGCLLFAMLTVTLPVGTDEGETPNATGKRVHYDNVSLHIAGLQYSDSCKDLLRGMLAIDPTTRMTIEQVLEHPFFSN